MVEGFEMELIKRQIDKYIRLGGIKYKTAMRRFNCFTKPKKFKKYILKER